LRKSIAFSDAGSLASATISGVSAGAPLAVADGGELVLAASGHRPFQIGVALILRGQIFRDELSGETVAP